MCKGQKNINASKPPWRKLQIRILRLKSNCHINSYSAIEVNIRQGVVTRSACSHPFFSEFVTEFRLQFVLGFEQFLNVSFLGLQTFQTVEK